VDGHCWRDEGSKDFILSTAEMNSAQRNYPNLASRAARSVADGEFCKRLQIVGKIPSPYALLMMSLPTHLTK
jgi:hypothetical protein